MIPCGLGSFLLPVPPACAGPCVLHEAQHWSAGGVHPTGGWGRQGREGWGRGRVRWPVEPRSGEPPVPTDAAQRPPVPSSYPAHLLPQSEECGPHCAAVHSVKHSEMSILLHEFWAENSNICIGLVHCKNNMRT